MCRWYCWTIFLTVSSSLMFSSEEHAVMYSLHRWATLICVKSWISCSFPPFWYCYLTLYLFGGTTTYLRQGSIWYIPQPSLCQQANLFKVFVVLLCNVTPSSDESICILWMILLNITYVSSLRCASVLSTHHPSQNIHASGSFLFPNKARDILISGM